MSEVTADVKVVFSKVSVSENFYNGLILIQEGKIKEAIELIKENGFSNITELTIEDVDSEMLSSINFDKFNVQFSVLSSVYYGDNFIQRLYQGIDSKFVKKFICAADNNQAGLYYYPCFYKSEFYDYAESLNPSVDKKLEKARQDGNLLAVLEKMLTKNKLVPEEMEYEREFENCVKECTSGKSFSNKYFRIPNIEIRRNDQGDTLLTALLKAGREHDFWWWVDVPLMLNVDISDIHGNTPYSIAEEGELSEALDYMNSHFVYHENVNSINDIDKYCFDRDLLSSLFSQTKESDCYLYNGGGFYVLARSKKMIPGESSIKIERSNEVHETPHYSVEFFDRSHPNDFFVKPSIPLSGVMKIVKDYIDKS